MNGRITATLLLALAGCAELKDAPPSAGAPAHAPPVSDAPPAEPNAAPEPGAAKPSGPPSSGIAVDRLFTGRDSLGLSSKDFPESRHGGIAAKNGRVYWVERAPVPAIFDVEESCSDAECLRAVGLAARPISAFDVVGDAYYYASGSDVRRRRFVEDGSTLLASGPSSVSAIAVSADTLVWSYEAAEQIPTLQSTSLATEAVRRLSESEGTPSLIAFAGDRLYWVGEHRSSARQPTLQSIRLNGRGGTTHLPVTGGFQALRGNAQWLYYGSQASLGRMSTAEDGRLRPIVTGTSGPVKDVVLDDDYVYWVESGAAPRYEHGRVRRMAHRTAVVEDLAADVPNPIGLALDGKKLFVACGGTPGADWTNGEILRVTMP